MKLPIKVAIMFLLLGGATLAIAGSFAYYSLRKQTIEAFYQRQDVLGSHALLAVDRLLYERLMDMQEMASGELLDSFNDLENQDLLDIEERLFSLKLYSGPWDLISIVDNKSQVIVSTHDELIGEKLNDKSLTLVRQAIADNKAHYSDVQISTETNRATIIFAAPFKKRSSISNSAGVVVAEYSLPSVTEFLDLPFSKSYLFNKQGDLIYTNDVENKNQELIFNISKDPEPGIDHSVKFHTAHGLFNKEKVIHVSVMEPSYLDFIGNEWMLISEIPESVVLKEVFGVAGKLLLITAAIAFIAISITLITTMKIIVNPVVALTKFVDKVGSDEFKIEDLETQSAKASKTDEIGILWKKFGEMIVRLKDSNNRLVTQIKITKKEHTRLIASIFSLPLGFILINTKGKIEIANKTINKILKLKKPLVDFEQIQNLVTSNIDLHSLYQKSKETKKSYLIKEVKFNNGQYLRIFIVPVITDLDNKEIIDIVIIFEDITEEKLLAQTRDEFFAVASHELRTPLTSIRGNASLIQEHFGDKIKDQDMKEMIVDIGDSSVRLLSVVEDFLNVSKLEQNRIEYNLENFDILALVKESAKELKETATKNKLTLSVDSGVVESFLVKGDKNRVKQVVINLIGNAIKFSKNGTITIRIDQEIENLKVSVKDVGIGIGAENQKMLFRKFTQAGGNPLTRDATRGTGLGLYISKMLIEGMGGKIYLESSEPGKGSVFAFVLPKAQLA